MSLHGMGSVSANFSSRKQNTFLLIGCLTDQILRFFHTRNEAGSKFLLEDRNVLSRRLKITGLTDRSGSCSLVFSPFLLNFLAKLLLAIWKSFFFLSFFLKPTEKVAHKSDKLIKVLVVVFRGIPKFSVEFVSHVGHLNDFGQDMHGWFISGRF